MNKQKPTRKGIRLDRSVYEIPGLAVSITICTQMKEAIFNNDCLCSVVIQALKDSMKAYGMEALAYCLMPTHLHVVLHNQGGKNIVHAIRNFKQRTHHQVGRSLWQRSFYDHFIREDEDLRLAMEYVVNNPVRAGLVPDANDFPWSHPKYKSSAHHP
jgi:putative transposase